MLTNRRLGLLSLNPKIDQAMATWWVRFLRLPPAEQDLVREAIKVSIRVDSCDAIGPALLPLDPVLAGLWAEWNDTLAAEAWRATLRLVFIKQELGR